MVPFNVGDKKDPWNVIRLFWKKNVSWTLDLLAHQDPEDIFRLLPHVYLFLVIFFFCKVLIEYLGYWMSLKEEEKNLK